MAETFKIFRQTTLPNTLEAYALYFIAPATKPDYCELYVTGSTGSIVKRILNDNDVSSMINTAISSLSSIDIVADIAERDTLIPSANQIVMVLDATGDPTVTSGAATYVYKHNTTSWIKISEYESLEVAITWANLQNKPTSSVADIDDAVSKRHSHSNKTELDKIGEDLNGNFTYNSSLPVIAWNSTGW